MRFTDYIRSAQTNLIRTKLRTFLTVLAVIVGTFTLAMVTALGQGVKSYLDQQLWAYGQPGTITIGLQTNNKSDSPTGTVPKYDPNRASNTHIIYMTQSDIVKIAKVPGISGVWPLYETVSPDYIEYQGDKYLIGAQGLYPSQTLKLSAGRLPFANDSNWIVLPFLYVKTFGVATPQDLIGKAVNIRLSTEPATKTPNLQPSKTQDTRLTIIGILPDNLHSGEAYVSYQQMKSWADFQQGSEALFVRAFATDDPNISMADEATLKNSLQNTGYTANTFSDVQSSFQRPITIVQSGLSAFAGVALFAAALGIINTLLMAVLERTREVGLLKALGMKKRGIFMIFMVEALSIGFWGGLIGVVLALAVGAVLNPILARTIFNGGGVGNILVFPPLYMAAIITGSMMLGVIAGTFPAIRASRLDPIAALRYE
jgi:putative ABC transport system permease protein